MAMRFPGKGSPKARKRAMVMASGFASAIASTLALFLIAREMGAEILGSLGLMLSFLGLFSFVGDMGNALAFSRLVEEGHDFDDCYSGFFLAKVKLTIAQAVVSGVMIGVYLLFLAPQGHTPVHPMSMFLVMGYLLIFNIAQIWVMGLGLEGREIGSELYEVLEAIGKVVLIAGILWIGLVRGDQEAVFYLSLIYVFAATLGIMILRNASRHLRRARPSEEIIVAYADITGKLVPFVALGCLVLNLDKVVLWYFTDPNSAFETLGIYFAAQRVTIFIGTSAIVIQGLLAVSMSRHLKKGEKESVSETLRLMERYITLAALPVTAFYVMFSSDLLQAFLGDRFSDAGPVVSLLAVAGLFTALASPHVLYLVRDRKYGALTVSSGIALGTLVTILFLLVPAELILPDMDIHGMNGAAIAMLLSSVLGFAAYRIYTLRQLDCRPHPRILTHILSVGIMVVSMKFLIRYFEITLGWNWILFFALLGVFLYGIPLYLVGEFLRRDFKMFKDLTRED